MNLTLALLLCRPRPVSPGFLETSQCVTVELYSALLVHLTTALRIESDDGEESTYGAATILRALQ